MIRVYNKGLIRVYNEGLGFVMQLFRNIRASMGGNIRTVCVGSAPMDPQQLLELQLYLSAVICEVKETD